MATMAAPDGVRWTDGMDEAEKYAFDLGGYIVLRGLLSAAEIDEMNAAVDQMTAGQDYTASASYANGSPMMRGTGNVARKVADALGVPDSTLLASAMEAAGYTPADDLRENDSMTLGALEQVLRRLVPPGRDSALSDEEVRAVLAAVPAGEGDATVRLGATRRDIGGLLSWPQPFCEPFRGLLCHPCLQPVLDTILGRGYRLDHGPSIIEMEKGSDGQILHGGAHERFTSGGFMEGFTFHAGHFFTGLTVVEVMLADENPGDGGLCVVPGSHKSNYPCPAEIKAGERFPEYITEVAAKKGDVVIFTETTTHGSLPWTSEANRRALLYKFSPGNSAYGTIAGTVEYPSWVEDMTPEQRAVMLAPSIRRANM